MTIIVLNSFPGSRCYQQHKAVIESCHERGCQTQQRQRGRLLQLTEVRGPVLWQGDRDPQEGAVQPHRRLHREVQPARAAAPAAPGRGPGGIRGPHAGLPRRRPVGGRGWRGGHPPRLPCRAQPAWAVQLASLLPREDSGRSGLRGTAGVPVSVQQRHGGPATESSGEQPEAAAAEEARQRAQPCAALGLGEEQNHAVSGAVLAAGSPGASPSFAVARSSPAASFSLVLHLEASNFPVMSPRQQRGQVGERGQRTAVRRAERQTGNGREEGRAGGKERDALEGASGKVAWGK